MAIDYEKMIKRFKAAKADKQNWESHLRECYRYAMPQRNTIDKWNPGQKKREWVFDSTAEDALEDFATRMESELIPANTNWMKLEAGTDIPKEEHSKVAEYLDETTKTTFNHIRSSNFSSQAHEAFLDLGISTGALIVEAGDGIQSSLNFRCISLSELFLERSTKGIIDTVFREITIQANDILSTWPGAQLNEKLNQLIENKPDTDCKFIEGVMVRPDGLYDNFVCYSENKHFLIEEVIESNPYIIFRESTIPGETYGRGRVMRALADIKTLNLIQRDWLKGLRWYVSPTFTATDDGVINPYTFSLEPGSVNAVGSNSMDNPTLRPLAVGGQPAVVTESIRMLQDSVRRTLISKPFGNVEETPVRTATEMSIRNADMAKTALGASGRIQNELLERLVARCVYILKEAGKIADFRVDGKEVAIKFTSPSSRMQDENQLASMGRFMEIMQALPPELVNEQIKIEDFPGEILDVIGLPNKLKRSDAEKNQRQINRQQQEAQQQQMAAEIVKERQS